jgi:PAS domain S-box-containing protein
LHDETAGLLTFPYWVDEHDPAPSPRPLGRGLTDHVLRTGEPWLVTPAVHHDLVQRGVIDLIGAPSIDWIGVPLRARDRTIGVLVVQSYTEGVRYAERERDILQFVSTQVAMAIDRKRAEAELRDSETRYRLLFDANPEAMWVYDAETLRFLAVNEAAVRRYGYAAAEFLALTIRDIRPASEHEQFERILAQGVAGPRIFAHMRHRKKDGTPFDVEVAADTIVFAGRAARLVLARDTSERTHLEAQLRQAQKMEAVGQLAGGIAHDFNNMLTAITGYSEMLLQDLADQDARRHDVVEIQRAAGRAATLTRQLLAFSRKQVMQPQVIDLNEVVAGAEKLLQRLIGENIALRTALDPALGTVYADPAQVEQVIVNLVVNARDAMPKGGQLLIETQNADLETVDAGDTPPAAPGHYALLAVSDTGVGMDEATRARVFEPFFTTKDPGKGTGLGLSTVYGIIKQSGGTISLYSEPGKGTTVKAYFPRVDATAGSLQPAAQRTVSPRGSETVLLVEDEAALRAVARRTLERQGYRVLEASDAHAALAIAAAHPHDIDLVLTDVVMPGLSGRELAERLAASHPRVPVLFMSGYTDDSIVQHGVLEAGIHYLQKPFTPRSLAGKVRDVLDGRRVG